MSDDVTEQQDQDIEAARLITTGTEALQIGDFDTAISDLEGFLSVSRIDHPDRAMAVHNLSYGIMMKLEGLIRHTARREPAIRFIERLELLAEELPSPTRWRAYRAIGDFYMTAYEAWNVASDALSAEDTYTRVAQIEDLPADSSFSSFRREALTRLAMIELAHEQLSHDIDERLKLADAAMQHSTEAYDLLPPDIDSQVRASLLFQVALATRVRGLHAGEPNDAYRALELLSKVKELSGGSEDLSPVDNLEGLCFKDLRGVEEAALAEEIRAFERALGPLGDSEVAADRCEAARNLAVALGERSKRMSSAADAVRALSLFEAAARVAPPAERELTIGNWLDFAESTGRWVDAIRAGELGLDLIEDGIYRQASAQTAVLVGMPLMGVGRLLAKAYVEAEDPLAAAATVARYRGAILRYLLGSRSQAQPSPVRDDVLAATQLQAVCYLIDLDDELVALVLQPHKEATIHRYNGLYAELIDHSAAFVHALDQFQRTQRIEPFENLLWDTGRWLGDVLVDVAHSIPRDSSIAFVPTGRWNLLPLQIARLPDRGTGAEWLIDRLAVTFLPAGRFIRALEWSPASQLQNLLVVGEPGSGEQYLNAVATECDAVKKAWPGTIQCDRTVNDRESFLEQLQSADSVHVASHASSDLSRPTLSHFALADGPVSIEDLVQADEIRPALMFLSACSTSVGAITLPDDSVSLAGVLAGNGAAHVIATSWPVDDSAAATLAIHFYELVWEDLLQPDAALRAAQMRLRDGVGPVGQLTQEFLPRLPRSRHVRRPKRSPKHALPISFWGAFSHTAV